jgi:hypothetical protein
VKATDRRTAIILRIRSRIYPVHFPGDKTIVLVPREKPKSAVLIIPNNEFASDLTSGRPKAR